jgi:4-hydroxybenzoate polyprenyltransferase
LNIAVSDNRPRGIAQLKLFFAFSRTPHGLLDMATPGLAALLWLEKFPAFVTIVLGLVTAFAGYTAVYAINDLVDYRTDKEKLRSGGFQDSRNYLDAAIIRHPLAQGFLSIREGFIWAAGWFVVALIGAFLLNPVCVLIFFAGCALEIVYCLMWKVTPFRNLVSGMVKTCGPVAGVLAVDRDPSLLFLAFLFLWLFFWEIGGQNIPNDWAEIEEDTRLQAKTILVRYGAAQASTIILGTLVFAVGLNLLLLGVAIPSPSLPYTAASFVIGLVLLLLPAYSLYKTRKRQDALTLFKRASYYPLACLILVTIGILVAHWQVA